MNAVQEPKKVYTLGGKRKFKAKVIDSQMDNQEIFMQAAGGIPEAHGDPDVLRKLRFRMAEHDYRQSSEAAPPSVEPSEPSAQPTQTSSIHLPTDVPFETTDDDFRVEE